jgi:carbonic anhydrase
LRANGTAATTRANSASTRAAGEETMSSKIVTEVLDANAKYVAGFGEKGKLALPPARRFAILTCMDARLDPAKYAGLSEGDAHVIRNAGGRASDDAIRSLVISHKLLGTLEWFVIHHTNCGMELFCDEVMSDLLEDSLATAALDMTTLKWSNPQHGGGCSAGHFIKWHTITNQEESVAQDVARIRSHPLTPKNIPIYGYIYDVATGRLNEVSKATEIGRAA